jgi:hypothetical protein
MLAAAWGARGPEGVMSTSKHPYITPIVFRSDGSLLVEGLQADHLGAVGHLKSPTNLRPEMRV